MSFKQKLQTVVGLCGLMVVIYLIDLLLGGWLKSFGIHPRQFMSLPTIFTAPFIHGSIWHLVSNLMGMAVFSMLCLLRGPKFFMSSSLFIIGVTGILVWLFGRSANHIGASGWLFGLWSLSIALAWFERSIKSIAIGVFVVIFYGGMIFGVLPTRSYISFESHLFGALSGILYAALFCRPKKPLPAS